MLMDLKVKKKIKKEDIIEAIKLDHKYFKD
jgi:hypothetical protein